MLAISATEVLGGFLNKFHVAIYWTKISIREKNSLLSAAKIPAPTTTSGREAWMDFYKAGPYSDELEIGAWGQSHESALN